MEWPHCVLRLSRSCTIRQRTELESATLLCASNFCQRRTGLESTTLFLHLLCAATFTNEGMHERFMYLHRPCRRIRRSSSPSLGDGSSSYLYVILMARDPVV